jgi:general secretion pathway protein E
VGATAAQIVADLHADVPTAKADVGVAVGAPTAPAAAAPQQPVLELPFGFARRNGIVVRELDSKHAICDCRKSVTPTTIEEVQRYLGRPLKLIFVSDEEFENRLRRLYETGGVDIKLQGLEDTADLAHLADALPEQTDLLESVDDAPIIQLVNALLTQAVKENASDIHVEPFENRVVVRFRVDGVLREVLESKLAVARQLVSRIKVMAKLDIAEKRLPQDGRISLRIAGRSVDVRVNLKNLGMDAKTRGRLSGLIHEPYGVILVTGPTGSGKTTTLYAALDQLNDKSLNILTVEDPIEYYIDGIGQTQVNTKIDMTFAIGLRAILRQDPDVVLVGEIRDLETAQVAVQASLTGHLVLSTLHTNTAVGAIMRLIDMGIEPFLLASSLIGVLAQRLVRTLDHENCMSAPPTELERGLLDLKPSAAAPVVYHPGHKAGTGYRGRTGIYELVTVDEQMRKMIHDGDAEQDIERYARTLTPSIRDDAIAKVLAGVTTVDEMVRETRKD